MRIDHSERNAQIAQRVVNNERIKAIAGGGRHCRTGRRGSVGEIQ